MLPGERILGILSKHRETALEEQNGKLAEELAQTKADYELKLMRAGEETRRALEQLRVELSGSAAEMAALQEEKAKEERVELLRRQITRRIMNAGISRGWTAWRT